MDVVGFAFATAFLVAAFTVFAILDGYGHVSAGIGSTVAPTSVSGFRAWTPPLGSVPGRGRRRPEDDGPDGRPREWHGPPQWSDPGLLVPVTRLAGRDPRSAAGRRRAGRCC